MSQAKDLTIDICNQAGKYPNTIIGSACNQTSFKVGKRSFLFIGPGPKGLGYKAMFTLDSSLADAVALSSSKPEQYQVGANGRVTVRFSVENPFPKSVWEKWLEESYQWATR